MPVSTSKSVRSAVIAGCALFVLSVVPFAARAQAVPIACKVGISAGLKWQDQRWRVRRLFEDSFTLAMQGDAPSSESVARALKAVEVTCSDAGFGVTSCMASSGAYLLFDARTFRGGIARLKGSVETDPKRRSTVSVEVFSCQSQ